MTGMVHPQEMWLLAIDILLILLNKKRKGIISPDIVELK